MSWATFGVFTLHIVCTGNLCRSPIAAALFRSRLPADRCRVLASGLAAQPGRSIDASAVRVLQAHGLNALEPVARAFLPASVGPEDLVLVMQRRHVRAVRALVPAARARTHLLGRWGTPKEIDDPVGGTGEDFERAYALIERCVSEWCAREPRLAA